MKLNNKTGLIVTLMLLVGTVSAIGIGAGPGELYFNNMVRGGYAKKMLMVNTVGGDDLTITIIPDEPIEGMIVFEPSDVFTLPARSRIDFWAIVQLPDDVELGNYTGVITVQASPVKEMLEAGVIGTGVDVSAAISIATTIEVTDKEIVSYIVRATTVKDAEVGSRVSFSINIQNTGNVKVTPKIHIDVLDRNRINTLKSYDFDNVGLKSTVLEEIRINMPSEGLDVGKYWAQITPEFGPKQLLSFNMRERGGLSMKGTLKQVTAPVWIEVGEMVKVSALFENTGETITSAVFKGEAFLIDEVYKRERLVGIIESDVAEVGTDELINMTTYFTPTEPGRYSVRGVVVYANKRTSEKGTIINVLPKPVTVAPPVVVITKPNFTLYYILAAVLVVALGLWKHYYDRTARGKMKKGWGKFIDDVDEEEK